MQSLSDLYAKSASLAAPYVDSDALDSRGLWRNKRRKKKRWDSSLPLGSTRSSNRCSCRSLAMCDDGGPTRPGLLASRSLFLLGGPKLSSCRPRGSPPCRNFFALGSALEQEAVGTGGTEEGSEHGGSPSTEVGFGSDDGEEDADGNADELFEKGRVDVRALAGRLKDAETASGIEELLNSSDDLPLHVFTSMIRGFGYDKRLDLALGLVRWLKKKSVDTDGEIGPNLFIYNSLLGAVKQAGQFDKADEVMEDMRAQGIAPNIVTYNALMSVYLEQGRNSEALDLLAEIDKNGLSPSSATYSTVLLAYKKTNDATGALSYFVSLREKYQNGEIAKDSNDDWESEFAKLENFTIRICYLVMRQWLVNGQSPEAKVLNLLTDIDDAGVRPSRADYERLVWACTRDSHYAVARELYRKIREMDNDISLSVCNHVIWLLGKAKKWWAALEIYEELLDKGPRPNNLSYELIISHFNVLLTAARRKGIWRWGVRLLNKMQEKGLKPGSREWNAVLVACSKASETSAAVQIFTRMIEQGEKPTVISYGALLSALEKGKLYDDALRVWEHMHKVGVKPNLYAYTILASVYIGKGNPEMVDSLLREMKSMRIEPTVVTFNAIITGCAKNNMGSAAFEWFHRMKVQNIKPNEITYDMLVDALARDGKPRLAYEMYIRACNEGLHLSSKSYDAVIEACQAYGMIIDMNILGPRPFDKRKNIKIRRNLTDFCNLADVPRRSRPFDEKELYASPMQET